MGTDTDIAPQVMVALDSARTTACQQGTTLRTPAMRAIAQQQYRGVRSCDKGEIFAICEQLLSTYDDGARLIAFDWAFRRRKRYATADFSRFEAWLEQFVDGWGSCDDFCTHAFGALIYQFPALFPKVKIWTRSDNRWLRRAAAVVLIYAVRRNSLHKESFVIADLLLHDEDDLVQKGYGWLLKEVSNLAPQPVFDYVMRYKAAMPRISLRYAIEKLDPALRQQAMTK